MRIVGGKYAGRHLSSPGRRVRPTPEDVRVRALELLAPSIGGARFLDLFAGSGAVGLEAISRGALSADFVENGAAALHALKANVAALRVSDRTRIFKKDVIPWVATLDADSYDIAFLDPPYGSKKLDRVVERWQTVAFAGILLIEHHEDHVVPGKGKRFDCTGPTRLTLLRA